MADSLSPATEVRDFPAELRELSQWFGYRLPSKTPLDARTNLAAEWSDPATWSTFQAAKTAKRRYRWTGLAFLFRAENGYTFTDFDKVRDPKTGTIDAEAFREVGRFHSWTEVSSSGTGLHVVCRGQKPGTLCLGHLPSGRKIEMYDQGRCALLTGEMVVGLSPVILPAAREIADLYRRCFPERPQRSEPMEATGDWCAGASFPEGERNHRAFRLAARMRAEGLSAEQIEVELLRVNQARCTPPLPEREVLLIARSVSRYPQGRTA